MLGISGKVCICVVQLNFLTSMQPLRFFLITCINVPKIMLKYTDIQYKKSFLFLNWILKQFYPLIWMFFCITTAEQIIPILTTIPANPADILASTKKTLPNIWDWRNHRLNHDSPKFEVYQKHKWNAAYLLISAIVITSVFVISNKQLCLKFGMHI